MDDLIKRSITLVESTKRNSVPWTVDKPWPQPFYKFSMETGEWMKIDSGPSSPTSDPQQNVPSKLALYSWNIDFMLPFADERMNAAIEHLLTLVGGGGSGRESGSPYFATVIYLQECVESDIKLLTRHEWIRRTFCLSDLGTENWQNGHYGTITLVDRRLTIDNLFRVHYSHTRMERDVLVADVKLPSAADGTLFRTIRLCNSHLESLAFEPPYRPPQMQLMAQFMHDNSIYGAVAAGDFNAIQPFDKHLHSDNHLKDAFLELGGHEEDATGGHTWGQQTSTALRQRFGTSRMDKMFFCGGVRCVRFGRFGAGVELAEEHQRREIVDLGFEQPWITDHLGVMGIFEAE